MWISKENYNPALSQVEVDTELNQLHVPLADFAEITSLGAAVYGAYVFNPNYNDDKIEINSCIRNDLVRLLGRSQHGLERRLGYALTPRYLEKEFLWNGEPFIELDKGIETLHVIEALTDRTSHIISPYIVEDIALTDQGDGFWVAQVSTEYLANPSDAVFRWAVDDMLITTQAKVGYPRRVSGNWEIPLNLSTVDEPMPTQINLQHAKFMILEVDSSECLKDPVYPDSNQKIPQAKEPERINTGTQTRYWFHAWSLIDYAFAGEIIDLQQGEFYKLLTSIDLLCFGETAAIATIIVAKKNCDGELIFQAGTETLTIQIYDGSDGVIYIQYGVNCTAQFDRFLKDPEIPVRIKLYYKVNPELINDVDLTPAREAIAYLTAADLPYDACGCNEVDDIPNGWIKTAKTENDAIKIVKTTGDVIAIPRSPANSSFGRIKYEELVTRMRKKKRLVVL